MANQETKKKLKISNSQLSPISSITEGYSLRYRVLSSDKNRASHWSPIFLIVPDYTYVSNQINFNASNQISNFTWDAVTILKDKKTVQAINNKELTSDIATLTTDTAHYMSVGDWVTVEGVDATFNGTYKISSITNTTFSYYKDHGNISSTAVSPKGTYKINSFIRNALEYDVWVRWDRNDGGDWIYKERIETTNLSLPHPSTYTINGVIQPSAPNRVSIEVYLIGEPVQRGNGVPFDTSTPFLKMYQLLNQTI